MDGVITYYPNKLYNIEGGTNKTKYIYAGNNLVATIKTSGISTVTNYIHTDHLGSTNAVSNNMGTLLQSIDYYPFGPQRSCGGTTCDAKKKYIGQYNDTYTALDYLNARYYDGYRGQFVSQDPAFLKIGSSEFEEDFNIKLNHYLMNPQSLNSYSYANNNPLTWSDPDGEILPIIAAGILVATVGFVIWDSYDVYVAFNDPDSTDGEKALAVGALSLNAIPGVGPVKGVIKGAKVASRGIKIIKAGEKTRDIIRAGDLVAGLRVTKHAEDNFVLRNMNIKQIETALSDGVKYFDANTNNILHVIGERGKGGYTIVTDLGQKTLVSVEDFIRKLKPERFKELIK